MLSLMRWYSILRSSGIHGITTPLLVLMQRGDATEHFCYYFFQIMTLKIEFNALVLWVIRSPWWRDNSYSLSSWKELKLKQFVHWHRSAFTTRVQRQHSCAVLCTEPFVLYSSPHCPSFSMHGNPLLIVSGEQGGGGVQNCKPHSDLVVKLKRHFIQSAGALFLLLTSHCHL